MDMTWLYVLLTVSLCQSLPAISRPSCDVRTCQVSEDTLDSALAVFFCYSQHQLDTVTEKEKKMELAEKIAPYLLSKDEFGDQVKELSSLDADRLVSLVNLILHDGDNVKKERKTEEDHIDELIGDLTKRTNLDSNIFFEANLILLSQVDCTTKAGLGMERDNRGAFIDLFTNLESEKELFVTNLASSFEAIGDPKGAINSIIGDATDAVGEATDTIKDVIDGGITNAVDRPPQSQGLKKDYGGLAVDGVMEAKDAIGDITDAVADATGGDTNKIDDTENLVIGILVENPTYQ